MDITRIPSVSVEGARPRVVTQGQFNLNSHALLAISISEELSAAMGKIDGVLLFNKFGSNPDIDTGSVPEDLWQGGGPYTGFPSTTLETVSVSSGSDQDAAGGTGVAQVRLIGLDGNYDQQEEDVVLTGTTPAVSLNTYRRVYRMYVTARGSGAAATASNAGILTATHTTTTANVFAVIPAGVGQTNIAGITVPAGYDAYLRDWSLTVNDISSNKAQAVFWTRKVGEPVRLQRPFSASTDNSYVRNVYGGVKFEEKTDVMMRVTSVVNGDASVTGEFNLICIPA